jgi:hypothetical protein
MWIGVHVVPLSLGGPARGLDVVATVDDGGDADLAGLMSVVSDVLTISQDLIQRLGDTGREGGIILATGGNHLLGFGVDDDELAMISVRHGMSPWWVD